MVLDMLLDLFVMSKLVRSYIDRGGNMRIPLFLETIFYYFVTMSDERTNLDRCYFFEGGFDREFVQVAKFDIIKVLLFMAANLDWSFH